MKKTLAKAMSQTVVKAAKRYAGIWCFWKYYQPKAPAKLKPNK